MTVYAPGTAETDPKKQNRSLQANAAATATNTTNIAANTAAIAALPGTIVSSVATAGLATGGPITSTGTVSVTAAAKSDQTTGSSNVLAVTPLHQQDHDSAAKAWCVFVGSSASISASYNISGVVRNSAGQYTVSFTTAFASANYVCNVTSDQPSGAAGALSFINTKSAGSFTMFAVNNAGSLGDPVNVNVVCFGRQ